MKILYRLRFIHLVLSIVFLILSLLALLAIFSTLAIIHLPYQDPSPEMLERQMEDIYLGRIMLWRAVHVTITGFCATILSSTLLIYLRHKKHAIFRPHD